MRQADSGQIIVNAPNTAKVELVLRHEDIARIEAAVPQDQIAGEDMRKTRFCNGDIVR